jgi:membrane-associated protein
MVIADALLSVSVNFYATFGYLLVFVLLFLESLPFIGAFIPGGILVLFLGGFIARLGFMNIWIMLGVAFLASISIDSFGYYLGRCSDSKFWRKPLKYMMLTESSVEKIGKIVRGHPGKALIFGRLNPVTRAIAPFVVGTEKVKFPKFFLFNVIGGALWVVLFSFAGYIFGHQFLFAETLEKWVVGITLFLAIGFYIWYLVNTYTGNKVKCKVSESGIDCEK